MVTSTDSYLPTVLAHAGPHLQVPVGWPLTCEGDRGMTAYVVVSGTLIASREGQQIGRIGPGELAGELALLRGERRNATLTAVTPVEVIALDAQSFEAHRRTCAALRDHLDRVHQLR
ncbi:MAG: cyclic nucleotide-binding domain-containing protein [Euzebya sp.]